MKNGIISLFTSYVILNANAKRMFLELLTETSKLWLRQYLVYVIVQPFIVIVLPDTAL